MSGGAQRRLAAIVAVDVVGYSRLMGADETGTLAALRSRQSEIIEPLIGKYGGRFVKSMGDGLLLEFPSVIAATKFAVAMQQDIGRHNCEATDDEGIHYRIGVHVGDVIIEGDDIFGNGVNIAARIEPLAKQDGICLSDDAHRQVRDQLDVLWEDGGEHQAKNIARPIRVWHWLKDSVASPSTVTGGGEALELPDKPSTITVQLPITVTVHLIDAARSVCHHILMARLARIIVPGQPHHVTQRGNGRQQTFFCDDDYRHYRDLLATACKAQGVEVWAWCLMPNHVHLVLTPKDADGLRRALSRVHRAYAGAVHAREKRTGHFWQGRFGAVAMEEDHLGAAVRYVLLNPVRARLVDRAEEWPWSSVHAHLGKEDGVTTTAAVAERYDDLTALLDVSDEEDADAEAWQALRRAETIGRPLGSSEFLKGIEKRLGTTVIPKKRGPKPKQREEHN